MKKYSYFIRDYDIMVNEVLIMNKTVVKVVSVFLLLVMILSFVAGLIYMY